MLLQPGFFSMYVEAFTILRMLFSKIDFAGVTGVFL